MVVKTVKETVNKKCKPLQCTQGSHGVSRWNIITHISSKLNSYINYISWNKMCVREIIEIRHETVNSKSFHFYVDTKNVLRNRNFRSFNKNFIYHKFVRNSKL